ncbi:MAG TPA: radical SAM protein [Candidatus Absconditabacterales bacterium]|nr:radical SAM protein [Candidatus Absconditabacterales bacterium]HMT26835.1 radical SAM protein [Candidatus Absconditabacterales bacterium]
MLSLYIHVPFCDKKCSYCSFFVVPEGSDGLKNLIGQYTISLEKEIKWRSNLVSGKKIKTLYFGGGTPGKLGIEKLKKIIHLVLTSFDCSEIEELGIELNPNPFDETFFITEQLYETFHKKIPSIRISYGIQSFDDEILKESGRTYNFTGLLGFFQQLQHLKKPGLKYNFDFIAFGKNGAKVRDYQKISFFKDLVEKKLADSFSLYTLELFEGSQRYHELTSKKDGEQLRAKEGFGLRKYGSDDAVYEEFEELKKIIQSAGYQRYELSNYALKEGKSIHNCVYREMGDYLGLGPSASSFLKAETLGKSGFEIQSTTLGARFSNTQSLKNYILAAEKSDNQRIKKNSFSELDAKNMLFEEFFLRLRTNQGIRNIADFEDILIPDYEEKLSGLNRDGFIEYSKNKLTLTDKGMDVYNSIISELLL